MQKCNNLNDDPRGIPEELRKDIFYVTPSYFDSLNNKILRNTHESVSMKTSFYNIFRPQLALAASFALILFFGYIIITYTKPDEVQNTSAAISSVKTSVIPDSISNEEITNYLEDYSSSAEIAYLDK